MSEINGVWLNDDDTLDIHLNNGHRIRFPLNRTHRQRLHSVIEGTVDSAPHTDGVCVYWNGGQRLSLAEIISMVER